MPTNEELEPSLDLLRSALSSIETATSNLRELNVDEGAIDALVQNVDGVALVEQVQTVFISLRDLIEGLPDTN